MQNNTKGTKSQVDKPVQKLPEISTEDFLQSAFDSLYDEYKDLQKQYNDLLNKSKNICLALSQLLETKPKIIMEYTSADNYLPIPRSLAKKICKQQKTK